MSSSTSTIPRGVTLERDAIFDPPHELVERHRAGPISRMRYYPDDALGWFVTGHQLVKQVLADTRFSSVLRPPRSPVEIPESELSESAVLQPPPGFFIRMDPPEHTRLRRKLTGVFTVKRMKLLEPRIGEIVEDQLDALAAAPRPADLMTLFALPVPSLVICELLGVPYADRDEFQQNSAMMLNLKNAASERMAAMGRVKQYIAGLARDKRQAPTDDVLSDLAADSELSDDEVAGIGALLLVAGHETTANMLGLGTLALLEHPEQLDLLRGDPDLMAGGVEELLRYLSIIHVGPMRIASEDVELGGETIRAGEYVTVSVPLSNRDDEKYPEGDRMDVTRGAQGHMAFGHGVHQCLGQQLARIEMRRAFSGLLRRFPALSLAIPAAEVPLRSKMGIYGVHELPVTW